MKKPLYSLVVMQLCIVVSAFAQWEQIVTPKGIQVNTLYSSASTLYAGTSHGVYKLVDDEWILMGDALKDVEVSSLIAIGNYVFAGTADDGIYRTSNGGETWLQTNNNLGTTEIYNFNKIGNRVVAGGFLGVWWTETNGVQWTKSDGFYNLTAISEHADSLYMVEEDGDFFISSDTARTWRLVNSQFFTAKNARSIVSAGNKLIVGTLVGVFFSIDKGETWTEANTNLENPEVNTLFFDGTTLYAGTSDGLFTASDIDNISWTKADTHTPYENISTIITYDNAVHVGNLIGVYKESSEQYVTLNDGFPNIKSRELINLDTAFLTSTDNGVWMSHPGSQLWFFKHFPFHSVSGLVSVNDTTMIGYNDLGVFVSHEPLYAVRNWEYTKLTNVYDMIALDEFVFLATDEGVLRSDDYGQTWLPVNIGITTNITNLFTADDYLFAAGNKLFRSNNYGDEWETNDPITYSYYFTTAIGATLYRVTAENNLYSTFSKSEDLGESWVTVVTGSGYNYTVDNFYNISSIDSMLFTIAETHVYASIENDSVWYRFDKGNADATPYANRVVGSSDHSLAKVQGNIVFQNALGNIWVRPVNSFNPPAAPSNVQYMKDSENIVTMSWTNKSTDYGVAIRRYWNYADIPVSAGVDIITFDTDTLSESPGYFSTPPFLYADDNGDWSFLVTATEGLNNPPTIQEIGDTVVLLNSSSLIIDLSGISDGDDGQQVVNVGAKSSDESILFTSIEYSNPEAEGKLTLFPVAEGTATVTVFVWDNAGGSDSTSFTFNVEVSDKVITGIYHESMKASVYPNPTDSDVMLTFETARDRSIKLLNSTGQMLQDRNVSGKHVVIGLSSYRAGLYFVQVSDQNGQSVIKVSRK